jgi:hypothetical protein
MKNKEPEKMVTEAELEAVWGFANFGPEPRMDTVRFSVLKRACGYCNGHTSECICIELGLLTKHKPSKLTSRGRFCLWEWFGKKGF